MGLHDYISNFGALFVSLYKSIIIHWSIHIIITYLFWLINEKAVNSDGFKGKRKLHEYRSSNLT